MVNRTDALLLVGLCFRAVRVDSTWIHKEVVLVGRV